MASKSIVEMRVSEVANRSLQGVSGGMMSMRTAVALRV